MLGVLVRATSDRRYTVQHRSPTEPESEVLSNPTADRLLARASELDAALRGGTLAVSELRAAATEAGISAEAFDAALAEMRSAEETPVPAVTTPARTRTWRWVVAAAAALLAAGMIGVARVSTDAPVPGMEENAILLRCLTPEQAGALVRPVLDLPTNSVVFSPQGVPSVMTVRATPAQLEQVRSVLEPYEGAAAPACARTR
jgi:hypothetical protein